MTLMLIEDFAVLTLEEQEERLKDAEKLGMHDGSVKERYQTFAGDSSFFDLARNH